MPDPLTNEQLNEIAVSIERILNEIPLIMNGKPDLSNLYGYAPILNNPQSENQQFLIQLLLNPSMTIPNNKEQGFTTLQSYLLHEDAAARKRANYTIGVLLLSNLNIAWCLLADRIVKSGNYTSRWEQNERVVAMLHASSSEEWKIFSSTLANAHITAFYINDFHIRDIGAKSISDALILNKSIQKLDLRECQFSERGIADLANVLERNTTVSELYLFGEYPTARESVTTNPLGNIGASAIAQMLTRNTTLKTLALTNHEINDAETIILATGFSENKNLTELSLSLNQIGDAGANVLAAALTHNKSLKWLNLRGNPIHITGIKNIFTVLATNSTLKELAIDIQPGDSNISDLSETFSVLHRNTSLKRLTLGFTAPNDTLISTLAAALTRNVSLKKINFYENSRILQEISPTIFAALTDMLTENFSLTSIYLSRHLPDNIIITLLKRNKLITNGINSALTFLRLPDFSPDQQRFVQYSMEDGLNALNQAISIKNSPNAQRLLNIYSQLTEAVALQEAKLQYAKFLKVLMDELTRLQTKHKETNTQTTTKERLSAMMTALPHVFDANGNMYNLNHNKSAFCMLALSSTNEERQLNFDELTQHETLQYFIMKYIKEVRLPKIENHQIKFFSNPSSGMTKEMQKSLAVLKAALHELNEFDSQKVSTIWGQISPLLMNELNLLLTQKLRKSINACSKTTPVTIPTSTAMNVR